MKENIERIEKQTEAMGGSTIQRLKGQLGRLTQSTFLKPFLLLNLMINVGLEWGGFPALGKSIMNHDNYVFFLFFFLKSARKY